MKTKLTREEILRKMVPCVPNMKLKYELEKDIGEKYLNELKEKHNID